MAKDGIVSGTSGDDTIISGYTDANGDQIDGGDAVLPGEGPDDDIVDAGGGDDTIASGLGDDTVYGGAGDDTIDGGAGDDTIFGDASLGGAGPVVPDAEITFAINECQVDSHGYAEIRIESEVPGTSGDKNDPENIMFTDDPDADPLTELKISQIGGHSDDPDVLQFDMSTFDDDFRLDLHSSVSAEDKIVFHDVTDRTDNADGTTTITYTGSDGASHEVTVEETEAQIIINPATGTGGGDGGNDVIDGGDGDDLIYGETGDDILDGGAGNDVIHGDFGDTGGATERESFNWEGVNDSQIDSSFTQDTGHVEVTYTRIEDTGSHASAPGAAHLDVDGIDGGGETVDDDSSLYSETHGEGNTGAFQWEFSDAVSNVQFNVNDIDGDGVVHIYAYDADGNAIPVDLTGGDKLTLLDTDGVAGADTADSNGGYDNTDSPDYTVEVNIDGPVSKIVVEHTQDGDHNSGINVTDIYFDAPAGSGGEGGDDIITGGAGADEMYGEEGNDTFIVDNAADADGDKVVGGNGPDDTADDDVLDLRGAGRVTITQTADASDDGAFSGTVTFENGETLEFSQIETILTDPQNEDPDAVDDTASTDEDTPVDIDVLANDTDVDGDSLTVTSATSPDGTVTINPDGSLHFEPAPDFNGTTTISYEVSDGQGGTDTATVDVTVNPVNDAPDAVDDSAATPIDTAVTIDVLANDSDPDGDPLTVTSASSPDGDVTINPDNTITFDPAPGFHGEATISYTVSDGNGGSDTAEVSVLVNDGIVEGSSGDDLIDLAYTGDPEGDMVDNNDAILPGEGPNDDIILAYEGDDVVHAGLGDDEVDGGAGDDTIFGEEGNDDITGGDGADTVFGGSGDDVIDTSGSAPASDYGADLPGTLYDIPQDTDMTNDLDFVDGGDGNDTITTGDDADTILGGAGNDTIDGGLDDDTIDGGTGDDTIIGGHGSDTIDGGAGNDEIWGGLGAGSDFLNIQDENDPLWGIDDPRPDNGIDVIHGGDGNDAIYGQDDADLLYGDAGDDLIDGGIDNDEIHGGIGIDTIEGGQGDDLIFGDDGADVIDAGTGDDEVYGGRGKDEIHGGEGNDYLDGETGGDTIYGDAGDDTIIGTTGIDTLYGGTGDDTISAGLNEDFIDGGDGNDVIDAGGYDDEVHGGAGDDEITAGQGDDVVFGDEGNDLIHGGEGADDLHGGDDRDTFDTITVGDTVDGNEGGDDWDTLDLTGSAPAGGSLHVTYTTPNEENGFVSYFDADGNDLGKVDFFNIEKVIPCFTPGTMIATPKGERPVEELEPGDRVITRDNGIQEIRWVGKKPISFRELAHAEHLKPILIRAGALGNGLPERDMMVSPNHRVLVANDRTALYFDEREVLAAAKHLVDNKGISVVEPLGVSYVHFMFDHHEVVLSDGAWTESFQPGDHSLKAIGNAQRQELFELFPELETAEGIEDYTAARRILKKHEARMLVGE